MARIGISYSSLADELDGWILDGEPALVDTSSFEELTVYVRRDDPTRLWGFMLEDASESLEKLWLWFEWTFGRDVVAQMAELVRSVPCVDLNDVEDEDVEEALTLCCGSFEGEVPKLDNLRMHSVDLKELEPGIFRLRRNEHRTV